MKVSKTGYKKNSKDKNQPSLLIPSNRITMKDVEFPVLGTDNYGNQQMMYPGQEYSFPGNYVYEKPMKNWLDKFDDGGATADCPCPPTCNCNDPNLIPLTKPLSVKEQYRQGMMQPDSWWENALEILDPTGVLSHDDAYRAYESWQSSGRDSPTFEEDLNMFSAVPLLGKYSYIKYLDPFVNAMKPVFKNFHWQHLVNLLGSEAGEDEEKKPQKNKDKKIYGEWRKKEDGTQYWYPYPYPIDPDFHIVLEEKKPKHIKKTGGSTKYQWGGPAFDAKKIQEALDQYNKMKIGYPYPLDAYQKKEVTDQDVTNYEAYMSGDKANKNYFYETHELVKNSDGTQSWKVKDDVNYNEAIKGTPLGQFIYKQGIFDKDNNQIPTDQFGNIYTDYTGLEMGYSPYNLWTSPTSGISLYNDNPNNILKQLDFVPDVYPTIYFLGANNPIKEGETSLWDTHKVDKGSYGFNESILGSGLADQGYSTLNLGDSFRDLDKLKGKYKETFGYGDDLLRVVDPTDYNVMGALQLTPEIVEYLKNLESELPDYKFDPYANRKQRAAFNQDELLKAIEGERIIKEYLLKQAGIDPALGMQYLMHYNYTPLDVYSEINNPSTLNWYNQIGAVKNKFQDISYDKYTNDPEYNRLLNQFLDENKVVRKTGGSTKWLDRFDVGGARPCPPDHMWNELMQECVYSPEIVKQQNQKYQDAIKWHEDWMNSPMYNQMLYSGDNKVDTREELERKDFNRRSNLSALKQMPLDVQKDDYYGVSHGHFDPSTKQITVFQYGYDLPTLMTHEVRHAIDDDGMDLTKNMPNKDLNYLNKINPRYKDFKHKNTFGNPYFKDIWHQHKEYFTNPTEVNARLAEIRKQSQEQKIYDPFTQKTPDDFFQKANFEELKELQKYYKDDQIKYMLDNFSYNQAQPNNIGIYQSKLGGSANWLDGYQDGGEECGPGMIYHPQYGCISSKGWLKNRDGSLYEVKSITRATPNGNRYDIYSGEYVSGMMPGITYSPKDDTLAGQSLKNKAVKDEEARVKEEKRQKEYNEKMSHVYSGSITPTMGPIEAAIGALAFGPAALSTISTAAPYVSGALATDATIGGLTLPGVNLGNAVNLGFGLHSANMLGNDIDTGYYTSDAPLVDKITRGLETGLGIVGSPGVLEGMGAGYRGLKGAYNNVAIGNSGSLLSRSRSGYGGIDDLKNYTGDISEGDIISNANVANYDFMTSPANIQKRAAFRSGPDPVNFGAPQIYGSLDPELQTAYEAARQRVLQEKHLYTDPKDIEFALNVEKSPSYHEFIKASGQNPNTLSGQFSQGLDMGFVNEMNQSPLSTWLSTLHEGNHGYLAKTGVMPQEKLLIDRAYKDIVYPNLQGLSENEKMMEGFAVQRELRALLGDKTGTKIFSMSDAPAIRTALETLKATGHPYLSSLDNTNMRALVQSLNKIGLASVTGVGLGYGLGYGFSGNDNTIHKLGGSTGKLDRYDTGGPKPKGVHATKKLNSAVTIGYTLEPNTIYLYTGDQWRALTGDDYNRFKENNPTVISDMETFNKSSKIEPRKQEARIEKQEAKRPNPKTSVVKNDKPAGTAWPVNSKEENDFINTYVYANRKPAPKETLFEKLMRQMDLKKRLNLTWAEDPSLMPSLSIEQEKRKKINSKFGDEQYPLFKDIYINYQKEQDKLRAEENRKNSELGFFDKLINAYRTHRGIRENVDNNIRNAVVNSEWIPEWVPGIGGMSPSGAYDAIKDRFFGAMASEDPEAIADANVDQGLKIQTSEDGKVKSRTEFGFHPNPDPNTGNWKLRDKYSDVPTDSLAKFTYTFDNDKGGKYIVSHKEKEMENGAQRRFDNVYAVSHFLRDADILPGQKFVPQYLQTHGSKLPNQAYEQGKYISYSKVNSDPEKYWMLSKPGANENERYIKYKKKKDITDADRKEWSVDLPTSGQHRFSDVDWDGNGVSTGYLSRSYWLPLKDNAKNIQSWTDPKHTRIPYKDKEAFSRFSGATVTYIFKDPTTGENISRDISGSINEIKKAGVNIIKTYGVKPEDLEFVYHDTGSYSAKPAAYPGNVLNHRQWAGFNSTNKGYSGAALMVPSKKYGGTAEYQDGGSKEMPLGLPLKEQNPYLVPEHYKPMANGYILQDPARAQLLNTGATEYKYSYDLDGKEVQVPSIVGGQYIGDQAIDRYMLTGEQFKPMADPSSYSKFYDDMYRLGLMQPEYKKGGVKTSAEGYYDYINGYKGVSLSKGGPSKKGWLEKYK